MKSTQNVGSFVLAAALLWACLPKPSHETAWESLKNNAYIAGHLLGWLPPSRPGRLITSAGIPRGSPGMRPANGTITEVQGFVDQATFKANYLGLGPAVFRGAASKANGFDLECLTGTGQPLQEEMSRQMGDKKVRVFKDSYDDGSATFMNMREYAEIAKKAKDNLTSALPYARAFSQSALGKCAPVPEEKLLQYHGMFSSAQMLPESKALVFYGLTLGSTTKLHMDVGDSFFTQVYGRKKWVFVDPNYATTLQLQGEKQNLFYTTGYDVHLEPLPEEVVLKEVILHPGDVAYFPAMHFHAVSNLDEVTLGIDQPCMDFAGALRRHWLCTLCSMLNPGMLVKVFKQLLMTGAVNGQEVYFDEEMFSATAEEKAK